MSRAFMWLWGPELYWFLFYVFTVLVARLNLPPTDLGNAWLERLGWLLPLFAVPGAFLWTYGFLTPGQSRSWLTARLILACLVGLNVCLFQLIGAIDYKDSRNSGVLGVWIMGLMAGLLAFAVSAGVLAYLGWKGRAS